MLAKTPDASCKLPLRQPSALFSCAALLRSLRNPHAPLAFFICQQDSSKSQRGHHDFVIFAAPSRRWPYLTHDPKRKSNSLRTAFDRTGQYWLRLRWHQRIVFGLRELSAGDALSRLCGAARAHLDLSRWGTKMPPFNLAVLPTRFPRNPSWRFAQNWFELFPHPPNCPADPGNL